MLKIKITRKIFCYRNLHRLKARFYLLIKLQFLRASFQLSMSTEMELS